MSDVTKELATKAARTLGETLASLRLPFVLVVGIPHTEADGKRGVLMVRANNGLAPSSPLIRGFLIEALDEYLDDTREGPQGDLHGPGKHTGGS